MGRLAATRATLSALVLCSCTLAAQGPPFRSGIDVVLVDLTVLDGKDRPLADLGPGDIELRVDGEPRPVRSLTFLAAPEAGAGMQRPTEAAPAGLSPGELQRTIMLVVDRESIPAGQGQQALGAAAKFVDRLPAGDRLAFATMPEPGERLRFEEPRGQLRERLVKAVGTWWPTPTGRTIFPWEAFEIDRGNREVLDQVVQRECVPSAVNPASSVNCRSQVAVEAGIIASARKREVHEGLEALRRLCAALGALEGPKHLVLLAGGIAESTESLHSVGSLASVAMANRVRVHVLQTTPNAEWISPEQPGLPSRPPFAPASAAAINLASATGGLAFAPAAGEAFFARLEKQLAGAYLLAFDPVAADRDGNRHRIDVRVPGRKGVSVRARAEFVVPPIPTTTGASPDPSDPPAVAASANVSRTAAPPGAPAPAPLTAPRLPPSSDPALTVVLRRMAAYVASYGANAALFVASERYDQRIEAGPGAFRPHTLESEFAIVRTRDAIGWAGYRDVVKVDGDQVADRLDRLQTLLTGTSDPTIEVRRIADESARYNVGPVMRNFNLPTTTLFFFHPERVGRFTFTSRGPKKVDGTPALRLDFVEVARPTLVMKRDGTDVPVEGSVWVVPEDGTIVRTRVRLRGFADSVRMSEYDPHGGARHVPRSMDTQPAPAAQAPGGQASQSAPVPAPSGGSGGATGSGGGGSSAGSGAQSGGGTGESQSAGAVGQATTSGPERGAPQRPRFDSFDFPAMDRIESRADVEVTFRRDPKFGVWLPARMSEIYEGPIGTRKPVSARATAVARYNDYRRFETSATMIAPK